MIDLVSMLYNTYVPVHVVYVHVLVTSYVVTSVDGTRKFCITPVFSGLQRSLSFLMGCKLETRIHSLKNTPGTISAEATATVATRKGVVTSLRAKGDSSVSDEDVDTAGGLSKSAAMSGVGSRGSNVLLVVAAVMVLKGLFLPEDIR